MKYNTIKNTDLRPSVITLGTASFGTGTEEALAYQLLDTYVEKGGTFIDTARLYGGWVPGGIGLSEIVIGKWLKDRGVRDNIVLATKGAHPNMSTMTIPRMSHDEIVADLDDSLRDLQTDHIDLYWLHRDDPSRSVADILTTLNEQAQLGKIRYFGCSNWSASRIEEAINYSEQNNVTNFVASQPFWSFAQPNVDAIDDKTWAIMDSDALELHRKTGMAIIPFSSQANGYFTKANAHPERISETQHAYYDNVTNRERLKRLQSLSQETSYSVTALVLGYLTNYPVSTFPIIAASNVEQLLDSLQAGDVELSPEQLAYLEGSAAGI
jgi:aryl-alcohol dehydrogenase-like predicted oxidoreductase